MENPEEVLQWLEEVARRRPAVIPRALEDYLAWVARTGEPVYRWTLVRALLKEKLAAVMAEYRAEPPGLELPPCPNVPPFDCDAMRVCFLAKLDAFRAPPFTVQRICELLAHPRKHYNRIDKFMRAFEKNILVVSTKRPEPYRHSSDADSQLDGSDANDVNSEANDAEESDYWDERSKTHRRCAVNGPSEPPAGSSDDDRDRRSTDSEEETETPSAEAERRSDSPEPRESRLTLDWPEARQPAEADKPTAESPTEPNVDIEEDKPPETTPEPDPEPVEPIVQETTPEPVEEDKVEKPHTPTPIIERELEQEPEPTPIPIPVPIIVEEIEPLKVDIIIETEPTPTAPLEPIIAEIPAEFEPISMDCSTLCVLPDADEPIEEPEEPVPIEPEAMDCSEDIVVAETKPPENVSDVTLDNVEASATAAESSPRPD